jgi:hypothetical protein
MNRRKRRRPKPVKAALSKLAFEKAKPVNRLAAIVTHWSSGGRTVKSANENKKTKKHVWRDLSKEHLKMRYKQLMKLEDKQRRKRSDTK